MIILPEELFSRPKLDLDTVNRAFMAMTRVLFSNKDFYGNYKDRFQAVWATNPTKRSLAVESLIGFPNSGNHSAMPIVYFGTGGVEWGGTSIEQELTTDLSGAIMTTPATSMLQWICVAKDMSTPMIMAQIIGDFLKCAKYSIIQHEQKLNAESFDLITQEPPAPAKVADGLDYYQCRLRAKLGWRDQVMMTTYSLPFTGVKLELSKGRDPWSEL